MILASQNLHRFSVKECDKWTWQVRIDLTTSKSFIVGVAWIIESWLKETLKEAGHGEIVVKKLSGLSSSAHKEETMSDFRSG